MDCDEHIMELMGAFLILLTTTALTTGVLKKARHRRYKIRPMNRNRDRVSVYENIIKFAASNDVEQFFKYTRMTPKMFEYILRLVTPYIERRAAVDMICPSQRLAMTLQYVDYTEMIS